MEILVSSFPLLSLAVCLPLLAAVLIWVVPPLRRNGTTFALVVSVVDLALLVGLASMFDYSKASAYQFTETYSWIPQFGVHWALGVNGLSLVMLLLASALTVLVMITENRADRDREEQTGYLALVLCLEFFMILIFAARDLFVFYLAFEAMLIPLYLMIGRYGITENRKAAALKFVIYSLVGGLVMLVGVIAIPVASQLDPNTFLYERLATAGFDLGSPTANLLVFLAFFFAFAIKAPMVPVHTWLADTAEAARPSTSTLLVGVLDKIGTYGMIVVGLQVFAPQAKQAAPYILVLAAISILYGAFAALGQKNLLRLVSFTSVSHFGFMVMAIFVGSAYALTGAMVYMVAHGVTIAGLFLLSGALIERGETAEIAAYGGLQRVTPVLAGTFLVTGLASVALPGLSGFVPEYMILLGTYDVSPWLAGVSVLSVILAAVYILLPYQKIFTGPVEKARQLPDLDKRERAVIAPLIVAMVILGVWAAPMINTLSPVASSSITKYLSEMEVSSK
ncbi:NADH-quinone oxidoreductase subunit M [Boudabousia tangfeifanii]|uniref:NADH-quinone oxidoreductase subunit M n=1 Tax=Boudabousia tangfeifanii TaxID=1912795 RepID=A0A1D9MJ25_9ACTO|nr:NADH-quinone oxidoreductase subunit M [Boudabousia tangfeifanii]AOZ72193.1 NADH-quinone oxidoreductase subunit M [Boudabousia tangfeifanii]